MESADLDSIEALCEKIDENSLSEAEGIIARARKAAEEKLAETRSSSAAKRDKTITKAKADAEQLKTKLGYGLNLKLKKIRLKARGAIIEEALDEVGRKLEEFCDGPAYGDWLKNLIIEGMIALDGDNIVVRVAKNDAKLLDDSFVKSTKKFFKSHHGRALNMKVEGSLTPKTRGAVVAGADGRVFFDNRVEARLRRLKDQIALVIAERLFD